ncbi:MAG: hypothetical protein UT86_C0004G0093 [Candidatus Magasanikbacteria bacterium GW2011_GWC2_40_17]|uniref:Glycosyltransferase RgtA/B/C/D-like domain-containing protein n=1 Tax=Candidatus Magasanikbacteria bacterium GW2011_GWA2_42_32 TaxID=1619039 RepID=A0A0G1CF11_9BACT|nr:MAG: hypothetical protein UT86_C0004G0093 [Candidatus Magasanikbacteria bacterium GW2011_GWC2_40_17]KKS57151.1 MAG: hypothetical protein UV20_C0003G0093 [Candidatus Magasanikbacteria bacterium GW2011_GWA2_42_32]OGH85328.1 MAG: hypothetical protein A2294_00980 [Candidatus Magasanikbacteria bacterium RIFOXYB2_FULL_38_10]
MKIWQKQNLLLLLFFLIVAVYFSLLQGSPHFVDPDSFYHAKMGFLMQKDIIIKNFPWIKFAPFTQNFTDHQFIYHLLLIPFTFFFSPLLGTKIAAIILAVTAFAIFYFFLKKWQIKYPLFYILILLTSISFVFRMNLAKTSSLSLIILLLTLNFIWQRRFIPLFLASFVYVWCYGGWGMLLGLIFSLTLGDLIINKKIIGSNILAILLGLLAGIIINPYFPHNIQFYWQQVVQIGLINYKDQIAVGMEWYPPDILNFLGSEIFIFLLGILALFLFFIKIKTKKNNNLEDERSLHKIFSKIIGLFIFAGLLFVLTLKSQRFIEYFVPFSVLACAFLINFSLPKNFSLKESLYFWLTKNKYLNKAFLVYFLAIMVGFFSLNSLKLNQQFTSRYNWNYLKNSSAWLKENTPPKTTVFHTSWADWPMLFYHNSQNTYLSGLDPTFFYLKDKNLYKEWIQIGNGQIQDKLDEKIKKNFSANWILIKNNEIKLLKAIKSNDKFSLVYRDDEAQIFFLR